jgi:hypothetical protein
MAVWQEKSAGRIGNTAKLFDTPDGHFSCNPEGRGRFVLWLCRSSLMGYVAHITPHFVPAAKTPSRHGHFKMEK